MRKVALIVLLVLAACGKKKDDQASPGSGSASAAAVKPAAPTVADAAPAEPAPAAPAAGLHAALTAAPRAVVAPVAGSGTCDAACAHRAECAVPGDPATCVADCQGMGDAYSADALAAYVAAACPDVVAAEPAFRAAVACKRACAHRAECIPEASDLRDCSGTCTALAEVTGDQGVQNIEAYATADCASAAQQEPGFQQAGTCVRGCQHVLECGVSGTFSGCLGECSEELQGQKATIDQIEQIAQTDCATVKQTVTLRSGTAAPAAGGGDLCDAACNNFDRCGIQKKDACMAECQGIEPDHLLKFANATCEQLRTKDYGDSGSQCMARGVNDCPAAMMCCSHGAPTNGQRPGLCLYPGVCYMPTH